MKTLIPLPQGGFVNTIPGLEARRPTGEIRLLDNTKLNGLRITLDDGDNTPVEYEFDAGVAAQGSITFPNNKLPVTGDTITLAGIAPRVRGDMAGLWCIVAANTGAVSSSLYVRRGDVYVEDALSEAHVLSYTDGRWSLHDHEGALVARGERLHNTHPLGEMELIGGTHDGKPLFFMDQRFNTVTVTDAGDANGTYALTAAGSYVHSVTATLTILAHNPADDDAQTGKWYLHNSAGGGELLAVSDTPVLDGPWTTTDEDEAATNPTMTGAFSMDFILGSLTDDGVEADPVFDPALSILEIPVLYAEVGAFDEEAPPVWQADDDGTRANAASALVQALDEYLGEFLLVTAADPEEDETWVVTLDAVDCGAFANATITLDLAVAGDITKENIAGGLNPGNDLAGSGTFVAIGQTKDESVENLVAAVNAEDGLDIVAHTQRSKVMLVHPDESASGNIPITALRAGTGGVAVAAAIAGMDGGRSGWDLVTALAGVPFTRLVKSTLITITVTPQTLEELKGAPLLADLKEITLRPLNGEGDIRFIEGTANATTSPQWPETGYNEAITKELADLRTFVVASDTVQASLVEYA